MDFGNNGETPIDGDTSNWDDSFDFALGNELTWQASPGVDRRDWLGAMYLIAVYDRALSSEEVQTNFRAGHLASVIGSPALQAGDADEDLDFDQLDLVKVQVAAKYLSGQPATWGEGDWDGAPGGQAGNPPQGNGLFDQLDIIAALAPGHYLKGLYAALQPNSVAGSVEPAPMDLIYVPGPSSLLLAWLGLGVVAMCRRRQRRG